MQKITTINDKKENSFIPEWRKRLSRIGFLSTILMMLPVPLILGNPAGWILVGSCPLLLPLIFGNKKNRWHAVGSILVIAICYSCIVRVEQQRRDRYLRVREKAEKNIKMQQDIVNYAENFNGEIK